MLINEHGKQETPETHDLDVAEERLNARIRSQAFTRRRFMELVGLAAGGVVVTSLLAACGGDDDDDDAESTATTPPGGATAPAGATTDSSAASTPAETTETGGGEAPSGGELIIGQSGEPDTLDMHRTESSISWEVGWALYDTLIIADEELNLHPSLAESWETADDNLSFTFKLREDVVFHDGEPFNAAAVKYNLDRVMDPATGSLLSQDDIGPYDSSELIDDYTIKVIMTEPYGIFIRAMSLMEFGMLSPKVADMPVEDVGLKPIGSGPFKFVEWVTQDHVELERFDEYNWGPMPPYANSGPAHIDRVTFKFIPDAPTRVAALEAGEVDAIMRTPGTEVARLEADGFQIIKGLQTGMPSGFIVNTNKFPTDDPAVRKAINLGLDREQISNGLYAGQEAPGYCPLTPTTFAHWDCTESIYFDPDAAKQALEDGGWTKDGEFYEKDGETLRLDVYIFGTNGAPGEAFQAAILPIGIDVNLQVVPFTEQKGVGFEGKHNLMIGRFDAPDPNILTLLFHSENIGENGFTWTHLDESDPDAQETLDGLLNDGRNEVDQEKRVEIYAEAQQLIVEKNMFVPLKYDAMIVAMKDTISGWMMNDLGYQPRIYDVAISS